MDSMHTPTVKTTKTKLARQAGHEPLKFPWYNDASAASALVMLPWMCFIYTHAYGAPSFLTLYGTADQILHSKQICL